MIDNIEVYTHSSIRITDHVGTIYIDPFQIREEKHDADYIMITHPHSDHYSAEDIRKVLKESTILVVPESMVEDARELEREVKSIISVKPGMFKEINGLEIKTVPAYNNIKPFHPKRAEWVGYILKIDGKRIYIAGDTGVTKEAKKVKCDVALVPIGGTYTMDVKKAADLINTIRPEYVIPTHYGNIVGKEEDGRAFKELVKSPVKVVEKIQYFK
ncbi:MBL fold metallo-hydrolase [Butyrivibrio sp. NC2002]|uniref:MBL fold metallo-hydrolase n=1 Tax=Butyrivibrio sp. NC2002 TaxID=1410610 RepID=UPI00055B2B41|nr:MBL fold metallo-hydrolase [Butyrivibrio sp. NC2002]